MVKITWLVFPNGKELLTIASLYWVRAWERFGAQFWEPIDTPVISVMETGEFEQVVI